ncbi:MAG: hypothetical protein ABIG42_09190 [bacterium]
MSVEDVTGGKKKGIPLKHHRLQKTGRNASPRECGIGVTPFSSSFSFSQSIKHAPQNTRVKYNLLTKDKHMNNIQPFILHIENLLKTAGILPASHPLIKKRILRKAKSPLQPHENFQAMRLKDFEDTEEIKASPTFVDIMFHHLENWGNIRQP